jgi:hypothetical protein
MKATESRSESFIRKRHTCSSGLDYRQPEKVSTGKPQTASCEFGSLIAVLGRQSAVMPLESRVRFLVDSFVPTA